jgi:hypothetical protein
LSKKSLYQANHNRDCCDYLNKNGNFGDWVITTAFYSALHFVDSKLFPIDVNGKIYNKLSDYLSFYNSNNPQNPLTPHQMRLELVNKNLTEISANYKALYDQSRTARYNNYYTTETQVKFAVSILNKISKKCK